MGSIGDENLPILRFGVPDLSAIGPEERSLFAFAASKETHDLPIALHDARTDDNIVSGAEGLDAQGFAYVKHQSALTGEEWFAGNNIEDIYFPEVIKLVCDLTGAKSAIINNCAFRRRLADKQADDGFVLRKGCELDKELAKLPTDVALVYGKQAGGSLEPARAAHIDFSNKGLRDTARYCRRDIRKLAEKTLDAEDAVARGENVKVPRYAAYSVWRPVRTVRRDPLAVCDARTIDEATEYVNSPYRALSNVIESGEYLLESTGVLPPTEESKRRWYWMPEQTPDEVLVVKFADTLSEENPSIARGCPHLSPIIPGTENEEPRCSIECRVLAFWE